METEEFPSDPIHEAEGKWWFWDETWAHRMGPYDSMEECKIGLNRYCKFHLNPSTEVVEYQKYLTILLREEWLMDKVALAIATERMMDGMEERNRHEVQATALLLWNDGTPTNLAHREIFRRDAMAAIASIKNTIDL